MDDEEKKERPNAWKAGRKPKPTSSANQKYGSDYVGGQKLIKADPLVDVAEKDDPAYTRFSEIVGGKEGLKELAAWSENPKAQKLFQLIDDGRFRTYGIKALAKRCGMTLPELCNLFREKHFLEMYLMFFSGMPDIAKGTVQDAMPGLDPCPSCIARGNIDAACVQCSGIGKVRKPGDKEARRDVFKAVGIHKEASTNITQIGNVTVEGVDDFEDLMKSAKSTPIINIKAERKSGKEQEAQDAEIIEG